MITSQNFRPELYISIGETGAMFTLRETYLHERWFRGEGGQPQCELEIRSFHHKNLGQDKMEAMDKALKASEDFGTPMTTTMTALSKKMEMRKILRTTPEEIERKEAEARKARAIQTIAYAEQRDADLMSRLESRGGIHIVGFGKYADMTFADAIALDPKYFQWLLEQEVDSRYNNDTQNAFIELYLERIALEPEVESTHLGTVGTRINNIEATVTFIKEIYTEWGCSLMVKAKTPEGQELVMFTTASGIPAVGKKMTLNAMISKHDEYEGVKQTTLKRPTKITEVIDE